VKNFSPKGRAEPRRISVSFCRMRFLSKKTLAFHQIKDKIAQRKTSVESFQEN
jgi:hypothetical protein